MTATARALARFAPFLIGVAEIVLFVLMVQWIGFGYTILLALTTTMLGIWLLRREGLRAWASFRAASAGAAPEGTGPAAANAGVKLLSGFLLVLPGFLTDLAGLLFLIPPMRGRVGRRLAAATVRTFPRGAGTRNGPGRRADRGPVVIEGEIVEPEPPESLDGD
jgi:UPF0716 protein FxsA